MGGNKMSRPTPETDSAQCEGLLRTNPIPIQVVTANFARKLERERDEARDALKHIEEYGAEEINSAVELRQKLAHALVDLDNMQDQRDIAMKVIKRLERERDEARESLASREVVIAQQNVITDLILERDGARAVANELSDIASKHLSFLLAITPTKPNEKHEKETEKVIDALKSWKKL
jgi:hypothetical protein